MQGSVLVAISAFTVCAFTYTSLAAAEKFKLRLRFFSPSGVAVMLGAVIASAVAGFDESFVHALSADIAIAAAAVAAITDAQTGYVFDVVTGPAFVSIITLSFADESGLAAVAGACAAAGALGILYVVTIGRGLGLGDVKLAGCLGAALGAADGLTALGLAFITGGVYASYLLVTRRARRGDAIRFAPYIAAGAVAVVLYRSLL